MLQKLLNGCQLIDEEMEVGEDSALKVQKEGENHLFTGTQGAILITVIWSVDLTVPGLTKEPSFSCGLQLHPL